MVNREKRTTRTSLTLFFALASFLILLSLVLLVSGLVVVLMETGVMSVLTSDLMNPVVVVLIMAGASLVLGAGLSVLLSRMLSKPMNQILYAMDELSGGNFKVRLHLKGRIAKLQAFTDFENGFNRMADQLDHTEILQSDFVNNFSHEFKTPIVSIAGFANLLGKKGITDEQRAEYTAIIEEESRRLSAMATNVLSLSKIENMTMLKDLTEFNLAEQIRGCVLLLEEKWSAKDLSFNLDMDEEPIRANEELLKQVWINLLDNAVKYADEHSEIGVSIGSMGDTLLISVLNRGPGIPVSEREHIFGRFYQVDRSRAESGNGIGLAVVKKIVDLHEGQITVSGSPHETVFTVMLPRGDVSQPTVAFAKEP